MGNIFIGFIIGWVGMFLFIQCVLVTPSSCMYRSVDNTMGSIQQKGSSDTYFTVTYNTPQEYLQQELTKVKAKAKGE